MIKRALALSVVVLAAQAPASGQQPAHANVAGVNAPWAVTIVHSVDLQKLLARIPKEQNVRVGIIGAPTHNPLNITTGLVVDGEGHLVTRLVNLDPQDKDQDIYVILNDGSRHPARVIGVDCATGFTVLKADSLNVAPPGFGPGGVLMNGASVRILSTDVRPVAQPGDDEIVISPSIKVTMGRIAQGSIYSKMRGALTLESPTLGPGNDSSIITTADNQVVGMAQFAGVNLGRAYLFPIELIRDSVVKRVLEHNDSVPAGWLGLSGTSAAQLSPQELTAIGFDRKAPSGVVVREVQPNSTAAACGIRPNDIIVGIDDFEVTGLAGLSALLSSSPAGRKIHLKELRNREPLDLEVVLGARDYGWSMSQLLAAEMASGSAELRREQIERELSALQRKYEQQSREANAGQRNEEIRVLRGKMAAMRKNLDAIKSVEMLAALTGTPPSESVASASDVVMPGGFTTRDLRGQLAAYFGARRGVLVTSVIGGSAADKSGLKTGDVIVRQGLLAPLTSIRLKSVFSARRRMIPLVIIRNKKAALVHFDNSSMAGG